MTFARSLRRAGLSALFLGAIILSGCGLTGDLSKANALVAAANLTIEDANKLSLAAAGKFETLFSDENLENFPASREKFKADAQETLSLLDKSSAGFTKAAEGFEQAGKLNVEPKFKEYLATKSQEFKKLAEANEISKKIVNALLDESVADLLKLNEKFIPLNKELDKAKKEREVLEQDAKKIEVENPSLFKS